MGKISAKALKVLPGHILGCGKKSSLHLSQINEFEKNICEEILCGQILPIEEIHRIVKKVEELRSKIVKTTTVEDFIMTPKDPTTVQFYIGLCITAAALLGITSLCVAGLYAKKRLSRPSCGKSRAETPPPDAVSIKMPQNPEWEKLRNFIMSQSDCRSSIREDVLYFSSDVVRKLQGYGLWTASLVEDISRQSGGILQKIMPKAGDRFDSETMEEDIGLTGEREVVSVNWPGLRDTTNNSMISKAFVSVRQIQNRRNV